MIGGVRSPRSIHISCDSVRGRRSEFLCDGPVQFHPGSPPERCLDRVTVRYSAGRFLNVPGRTVTASGLIWPAILR